MTLVSPILRHCETFHMHWCPACEEMHPLPSSWTFNGDVNKPTFSPSFKQTFVANVRSTHVGKLAGVERVCHYIITDGMIQFCPDSWHKRSDIVAMPIIPPAGLPRSFDHETQD